MFRLDRARRAGQHLRWKVRLFSVGAVLALTGIYLNDRWLTGAAIVVLTAGVGIRFLPGGRSASEGSEEDLDG